MLIPLFAPVLSAALALQPTPVAPEPTPLSQENRALLRCAAALAQLMDETGRDRTAIAALAQTEAQALTANGDVAKIMPSCLLMLEAARL